MKLTWKKQNKSNKRSLSSISRYPNLPFDQKDDDHNHNSEDRPKVCDYTEREAQVGQNDAERKTLASDYDETAKLAEAFQAQGNKLAEVLSNVFPYLSCSSCRLTILGATITVTSNC